MNKLTVYAEKLDHSFVKKHIMAGWQKNTYQTGFLVQDIPISETIIAYLVSHQFLCVGGWGVLNSVEWISDN